MTELLAPNGKQSNLTDSQYKLVRTPEFKAWFGDWENDPANASKVVDSNGEPLIKYRGDNNLKNVFDYINYDGHGVYYFGDKMFAESFGDKLNSYFINAKNPFIPNKLTDKEEKEIRNLLEKDSNEILTERIKNGRFKNLYDFLDNYYLIEEGFNENSNSLDILLYQLKNGINYFILELRPIIDWIKNNNYDGYESYEGNNDNIAVFNSNQIKLADGTNTSFNNNNNDIRYKQGGEVPNEIEKISKSVVNDLGEQYSEKEDLGKCKEISEEIALRLNKIKIEAIPMRIIDGEDKKYNSPVFNHAYTFLPKTNQIIDTQLWQLDGKPTNLQSRKVLFNWDDYKNLVELYEVEPISDWENRFSDGGEVIINPTEIECHKCHWKWPVKQGGNDLFICHKCNTDNSKFYKFEGLQGEKILDTISYGNGGRTISQTPSPKKDRVYGSEVNKKSSSSSLKEAKKIQFGDKTILTITKKVKEHNEKYPNKKINLASAKAVVRRGTGAYSNSHRPTISNNKPNSRVAWGIARLNAFIYKIINGKSKSGKYTQDDDLINELKMTNHKFNDGGNVPKSSKMFHLPLELVVYVPSTKDVDKIITKQEMKERVDEVKNYLGTAFGGYSSVKVEGGYVANDGDLVNEDITKVVSFASKEDYEKKKDELVGKMTYWSEKWGQEAIGFEFEGDLYYVPEKLKRGGKISNPTFRKLNEEMKLKRGGGVYEGWGFNDRVKVLLKGTKNNILKTFKELTLLFPGDDKEVIENKTIEIFIDEKDLRKLKKIANYNQITMLYEAGGEIDYSTGWNQDYENDPLVKAKRKAKELAIRAAMAYATKGASEIHGAEAKAVEKMQEPAMQPNQDQTQMLMQLLQSGEHGKMAQGGMIDYSKGGSHTISNQELKSLQVAFNRFADKERKVIFNKGGRLL